MRTVRAKLLVDGDHYREIVSAVEAAKTSVWISTANLKAMLVEAPVGTRDRASGRWVSFFTRLAEIRRRGVDVCILHASPPSGPLARELSRMKASGLELPMRQCPRVHLKMIAIDGGSLYLGSANLTGAGFGGKADGRRNFEMGIVTDSESMLDAAQARFDAIWRGRECGACKMRRECPLPIDALLAKKKNAAGAKKVTSDGASPRACRSPSAPRSRSSRARSS